MAVLYASGWEAGTSGWYGSTAAAWTGNPTFSSTAGDQHRTAAGVGGNWSISIDDSWSCIAGTVVAGTARWFHTWMRPNNPGVSRLIVQFARAAAALAQVNVHLLESGNIDIFRGSTLLTSTAGAYNPAVAHWIAIEVVAANAGGVVNVYVDNVLKATASGDTQSHATLAGWDAIGFATSFTGGLSNNNTEIDDLIITDVTTGKVTEHYIIPIVPDGDSSPLTLTPSTGITHYNLVDEIPAVDTDYNNTTVSGNEDLYTMSSPGTLSSVLCAVFCARATRDGALTHGQVSVKSGATTVYQAAQTLPASPSYLDFQYVLDQDPDTAAAWTSSGIGAVQAGFKITT